MKVLLGIVGLVLALPVILIVGIALGPAILVLLFIGLVMVFSASAVIAKERRQWGEVVHAAGIQPE